MESIFSKAPVAKAATVYDRIGPEIRHLEKRSSARHGVDKSKAGAWAATIAICLLLGLFFMDPFLFSFEKSASARAYVYLHNYASDSATDALASCGMFTKGEIKEMNEQHGSFQSYFTSPTDAKAQAQSAIDFMNGMRELRSGHYPVLDPVGKLRYLLFIRIGLFPPQVWSGLDPSVEN